MMAFSPVVRFLIKKYLRFDKTQPFISITAILAFLGVAVGVMVLIVAMAIMNGFDKDFEKKLFTMNYPITIYPKMGEGLTVSLSDTLQQTFPSMKFSPFIRANAIAKSGDQMEGSVVFGVDLAREAGVNDVVAAGAKRSGVTTLPLFGAIAGQELIKGFALHPHEKMTLIFTRMEPNGMMLSPTIKRFDIEGSFSSGLIAYDKSYIYTSIEAMRAIMGLDESMIHGIHVYSAHPMDDIVKLKEVLPAYVDAIGWWEQNGNFFSALALEKRALFIVLMLIILVASLNIVSSLLMTVMNRRREIALFLSLGGSPKEVRQIFLGLGLLIGGGGVMAGLVLSGIVLWALGTLDIISLPADVYGTTKLPLELSWSDFLSIVIGAFSIVWLSSYYPAKKASQIDILTVLRHE